jgi:ribonuclease P protein component
MLEELRDEKFYQHRQTLSQKVCRITKTKDYRLFYRSRLVATKFFVLYYLPSDNNFHYGVTASKRIGNAVTRNKYKRIIKSLVRDYYQNVFLKPLKVNITAKASIAQKNFIAISQDFNYAMNKVLKNV